MITVTMVTIMKFYNREQEIDILEHLDKQAKKTGVMTVLTGRRRVGKTMLGLHYAENRRFLYLFVARKEEYLLCQEYLDEIKKQFNYPIIGEIKQFKDIFALLLEIAKKEPFTLIFDEFQEFFHMNASVYSDIQRLWDLNKDKVKIQVIFIGSIYSLMYKIFEDKEQPLFGRANRILQIKPFSTKTTAKILKDYHIFNPKVFFDFFVITGNLPKYLELILEEEIKNFDDMLDAILQKDSIFLNEGRNLLIEEFGRDYASYFSILALISQGKTSRTEIESNLEKDVGGYLMRLEENYGLISRHRPINAKPNSRKQKYKIIDNFLNFWFCFIHRYWSAIEMENFAYVKKIIKRDYSSYCGPILERFFQQLLSDTGQYNQIGSYWEKDNRNEIDIVAINDLEKQILLVETKINKSKINLKTLERNSEALLKNYPGYQPTFKGLSIEDSVKFIE